MLLKELWYNLEALANADGTDDFIGPDDFNRIVKVELLEFTSNIVKKEMSEGGGRMLDYLMDFATAATYQIAVPSDCLELHGVSFDTGSEVKHVKIIPKDLFSFLNENLMTPPLAYNYVAYIDNPSGVQTLIMRPSVAGTITLSFYRKPLDPFLDYYLNANKEFVPLDDGASILITGGAQYRDGATSGTQNSITEELDIPTEYHDKFFDRMVDRLGLKTRDQLEIQYAMAKKQEDQG